MGTTKLTAAAAALALGAALAGAALAPAPARAAVAAGAGAAPALEPFCSRPGPGVQGKLCRLLSGLLVRMTPAPEDAPMVRLDRPGGVYRDGEPVTVTVEVPRDVRKGYLHVAYLDEGGRVLHLLSNPSAAVRGGQHVVLGAEGAQHGPGPRGYEAGPPRGRGLILTLVSPRPLAALGGRGAGEAEGMGGFLAALGAALRAEPDPTVLRFARAAIETRPR